MKIRASIGSILILTHFLCGGCASYDAYHARFHEPKYLVTDHFYQEAPQKIAILPFAGPTDSKTDLEKGEKCRRIVYQQMSVTEFESVRLRDMDSYFLASNQNTPEALCNRLFGMVRQLDVVGMTDLLDLPLGAQKDTIDHSAYTNLVCVTRTTLGANACMLGYTRSYGRLYALVFSSIGISTRLELMSADTGALLWRGEAKARNYEVPLTLSLQDVPAKFLDIWRNSRGDVLDSLAFGVYRDLVGTIPYVSEPKKVSVRATVAKAPFFKIPTIWMLWKKGSLPRGEILPFLMEQNGWYKCSTKDNEPVWIFRRHAILVDESGNNIKPQKTD